jgi:hypothetical protein
MKLRDMHLDIGTINHLREFMRMFVKSMTTVMDRKIGAHLKAINPIT